MAELTIVVGNKNYSSWSLRPWLALKATGAPFREVVLPLGTPEFAAGIAAWSPSGRVPALRHGDLTVWDSLAICEYLAELFPDAGLWPADSRARAVARSVSAEMHSGFGALRENLSMNIRADRPGQGIGAPGVRDDIDRIRAIWRDCRAGFGAGGAFLLGSFGIADAMFAPVVARFRTYGVKLEGEEVAYAQAVWDHPAMQEWVDAARQETTRVAKYE
jgi:glutathione S-transferase